MSRLILALVILSLLPPTKPVDDDYTAVRKDVLESLNLADINLPKCEAALAASRDEIVAAQLQIAELRAAAETLQKQKTALEAHITGLESALNREPSYGDQFVRGWERIDGPVGLGVGWGLGTLQCVGLAWVFNQDAFRK